MRDPVRLFPAEQKRELRRDAGNRCEHRLPILGWRCMGRDRWDSRRCPLRVYLASLLLVPGVLGLAGVGAWWWIGGLVGGLAPLWWWWRLGDELEADHIYPHARGGDTELGNGQMLCRMHNARKSAHVPSWWYRSRLARGRRHVGWSEGRG
jgi:hypothetical protein